MVIPIIDAHIHLFPETHLPTLTWYNPSHPLASQHSIDEYRKAVFLSNEKSESEEEKKLEGFIFVECDRISSVKEDESGDAWANALDEVSFLGRIISGQPVPGEGHQYIDSDLCKGFVAWAPVPGGPQILEKYFDKVERRMKTDERIAKKLCGARYLVQSQPAGVMTHPDFIAGIKWLATKGLAFDLTVDARSGGLHQLHEALEMLQRLYANVKVDKQAVVVLDHLCKPNLRLEGPPERIATEKDFIEWKDLVTAMAKFPNTFMKLSGAFSELYPLSADDDPDYLSLVRTTQPWTDVVFDAFGSARVIYSSDWPVCNIGGGGNEVAWGRWKKLVEMILESRKYAYCEKVQIWVGNAMKAYGLSNT